MRKALPHLRVFASSRVPSDQEQPAQPW